MNKTNEQLFTELVEAGCMTVEAKNDILSFIDPNEVIVPMDVPFTQEEIDRLIAGEII